MTEPHATAIQCNHCGGPLEIPDATRFVTCSFCGSCLELRRSGNAIYTEVLAAIEQRTRTIAKDVEAIRRQNEIERLDREWQMQRASLATGDEGGSPVPSSAVGSLVAVGVAVAFGVFWIRQLSSGAPVFVRLFGVVFLVVAVVSGISWLARAGRSAREERRYLARRRSFLQHDADERQGGAGQ